MGINDVNIDAMASDVSARHGSGAPSGGDSAPSSNNQHSNNDQSSPGVGGNERSLEDTLNLDGVMKFKFGNREWTPDQLKKAIMFQSDYTKKTQQVAEKEKYISNLEYDLENIRQNPQLKDKFLEVYPKEFHRYLRFVESNNTEAQNRQTNASEGNHNLPPEILQKLERVENYVRDTEVRAKEAEIDAKFSTLSKKYPEAIEDVVLARAQALIDNGVPINDQVWEKLWKKNHDELNSKFEARQKTTLQKQRASNQSYAGPANGGGVPSGAPVKESFKQATDRAIRELSQGRK